MEEGHEFPAFEDGDVHIVLSGSRQYMLHSSILKSVSTVFRTLLSEQNAIPLTRRMIKKGMTARYRIDANHDDHESDLKFTLCARIHFDENGESFDGMPIDLDLENGRLVDPIYPVSAADLTLYSSLLFTNPP